MRLSLAISDGGADTCVVAEREAAARSLKSQSGGTLASVFIRTQSGKIIWLRDSSRFEANGRFGGRERAQIERIYRDYQNIVHVQYATQEFAYGRPVTAGERRTLSVNAFADRFAVQADEEGH